MTSIGVKLIVPMTIWASQRGIILMDWLWISPRPKAPNSSLVPLLLTLSWPRRVVVLTGMSSIYSTTSSWCSPC